MLGWYFLSLAVHAGAGRVIDMHAVHADVALPCLGITGDYAGQGDEPATILRPALEYGEVQKRKVLLLDYLLTRSGWDSLGKELAHVSEHGQHLKLFQEAFGRLHVQQLPDALGDLVQAVAAQRHPHTPSTAHPIHPPRNTLR